MINDKSLCVYIKKKNFVSIQGLLDEKYIVFWFEHFPRLAKAKGRLVSDITKANDLILRKTSKLFGEQQLQKSK